MAESTQIGIGSGRRQRGAVAAPKKLPSSSDGGEHALALHDAGLELSKKARDRPDADWN